MKHWFFTAVMAAGLAAVTLPANAGGHEWWRSCGGIAYEGCDGIERGPYAHHYTIVRRPRCDAVWTCIGYRHGRPVYGWRQICR